MLIIGLIIHNSFNIMNCYDREKLLLYLISFSFLQWQSNADGIEYTHRLGESLCLHSCQKREILSEKHAIFILHFFFSHHLSSADTILVTCVVSHSAIFSALLFCLLFSLNLKRFVFSFEYDRLQYQILR
jgi:hypothetical protein